MAVTIPSQSESLAVIPEMDELQRMKLVAETVVNTEFVPNAYRGRPAAVLAAIFAGRELGIGPMQALQQINVIQGKPTASAELQLALIRRAGHSVKVVERTSQRAEVYGKRSDTGDDGTFEYTLEDAKRAELLGNANWKKYPRNMLFWRAVSDMASGLFSDVVSGIASLTPDEMGSDFVPPPLPELTNGHAADLLPGEATAGAATEGSDDTPRSEQTGTQPAASDGEGSPPPQESGSAAAESPAAPPPAAVESYDSILQSGQRVTLYRVRIVTDVGERVLGPFNTEAEAQHAMETGELPALRPGEVVSQPAAEESKPKRKGSRGIAPGMQPAPQPEPPAPTLEQQLEESVAATAKPADPAPDDGLTVPEAEEAQNTSTAEEAREQRILDLAVQIKTLQHERKGQDTSDAGVILQEAQTALDQLAQKLFQTSYAACEGDQLQQILDWLEDSWAKAQAA